MGDVAISSPSPPITLGDWEARSGSDRRSGENLALIRLSSLALIRLSSSVVPSKCVDLETGRLGRATDIGLTPDIGWVDVHPDPQGVISGGRLPMWPDALALARQAHAALSYRVIVGWDIAITPEGPFLVEGNVALDPDLHQRASASPWEAGALAPFSPITWATVGLTCNLASPRHVRANAVVRLRDMRV
jgi:hypothetical protein